MDQLSLPVDPATEKPTPGGSAEGSAQAGFRTQVEIVEGLRSVDWTFPSRFQGHEIEALHPYPAKFISEIPRTLLGALPLPEGTAVFDPFCGSGTTLLEAQRLGMSSVGVDLNPIACLLSRVKTAPEPARFRLDAAVVVREARLNLHPVIPNIPNVDHWFNPQVQVAAAALVVAIGQFSGAESFDALRLALSSILVRVSNQESDTRYAAVPNALGADHVFAAFSTACRKLSKALASRDWALTPAKVVESDILKVSPEAIGVPVGLVVTSPPYPNAYEYWLYHKYRMWWLGFDPLAVKEFEIGARAHFFKRERHTAEHFRTQMRGTFALIDSVLVPSGWTCFVIGRSRIHGETVDNAAIIRDVAGEFGLRTEAEIERIISPTRKSFNLSHANIKTETVVILRKG